MSPPWGRRFGKPHLISPGDVAGRYRTRHGLQVSPDGRRGCSRDPQAVPTRQPHPPLQHKRLLIVSGKGGVGKSTVSAALALSAVRRGLRTVIVEVAARGDVARLLGATAAGGHVETEVVAGLHHVSIDRRPALEEYLRDELPGPLPAGLLARNRAFGVFVEATPGMTDLLTIGKVWELTQERRHRRGARPYDQVIVDGPASGQLPGLLAAPRTFSAIARVGAVARQCQDIERTLTDHAKVGVIAVATGEQMPVTEALTLQATLRKQFGIELDAVIANRLFASRFHAADRATLSHAADEPAVRSARWLDARARAQRAQVARLQRGLGHTPCPTLPYVFADPVGADQVEALAGRLDRALR